MASALRGIPFGRASPLAGALAPLVFLAGLVVASRLQGDFMEEVGWGVWPHGLSLGPHGWLYAVSAVALGVLLLAFAPGVYAVAGNAKARVAAGFFAVAGLGALLMSGKTELKRHGMSLETANPFTADTWQARLSGSGFWLFLLTLVSAYFLLWFGIREEQAWRRTRRYSLFGLGLLLPVLALPAVRPLGGYIFLTVVLMPLTVFGLRLFFAQAFESQAKLGGGGVPRLRSSG